MIEIKEGPELDQAIAAVAFNTYYDRRRLDDCPRYSTDLNAAFAAAEAVGLFEDYALRQHPSGLWAMCEIEIEDEGYPAYSEGQPCYVDFTPNDYATPALAICAAILKLKEEKSND